MPIIFVVLLYACSQLLEKASCLHGENLCEAIVEGRRQVVCCSDFEEQDGSCVSCKKGFTSENGAKCRPCRNDSYGLRCGEICQCLQTERCDNVLGCVYRIVHVTPDDKGSSANEVIYYVLPVIVLLIILGTICLFMKFRRMHNAGFEQPIEQDIVRQSYAEIDETAIAEDTQGDLLSQNSYLEANTGGPKSYANEAVTIKYDNSHDAETAPDLPDKDTNRSAIESDSKHT